MKRRALFSLSSLALAAALSAAAAAQPPGPPGGPPGGAPPGGGPPPMRGMGGPPPGGQPPGPPPNDPIGRYLYPPEAVLGHAQELGLTDAQRKAIRDSVHEMQKRFLDMQFDLEERTETVSRLVQQTPVDEAKVLAAVDNVLALENQIKKAQLSLLVRIKNQLTAAQVAKLDAGLRGGA